MPYIQGDFKEGLSEAQKEKLVTRLVEVVNKHLGSSIPHITVVVRDNPPKCIAEAGQVGGIEYPNERGVAKQQAEGAK
jgi:phenylpyruvate tautomerase PptA (4-oxalocrotonate tautomerase family)